MNRETGIIIAAFILGLGVLAGSHQLSRSLDRQAGRLAAVESTVAEARVAAPAAGVAAAAPPAAPERRGPDPERVYTVSTKGAPRKGAETAAVTVVEFSDFQCPYCSRVSPTLERVAQEYGGEVAIVFKHMPLSFHTKAEPAHKAAEAAHRQGRFWEMHDLVFANQKEMSEERYIEYAEQLDLDVERFKQDMASVSVKERIDGDLAEARRLGVQGTPSFFINGRFLSGARPFDDFKQRIDEELERKG